MAELWLSGIDLLWAGLVWLFVKGYIAAFLLGAGSMIQIEIVKNARQIRRNSETIRAALRKDLEQR